MDDAILTPLLDLLDIAGVAVFALSGALVAARERQTFVTMAFFALFTGVGGGTIRDLLIDAPVFWVGDPWIATVCLGMAFITWVTPIRVWEGKLFVMADGIGLAAYAVLGSAKAIAYGVPPVPAALMGVITGIVGGVLRDVVAGRPSIIMRPELYVTAAILSATLTVIGMQVTAISGANDAWAWGVAFIAGWALRTVAVRFRISFPSYGSNRQGSDTVSEVSSDQPPASPGNGPPG